MKLYVKASHSAIFLNLETGLQRFRSVYRFCFVCEQFCMSFKVYHREETVKLLEFFLFIFCLIICMLKA